MSFDNEFEGQYARHFRTRAVGQAFVRPREKNGTNALVMELTANELEFKNSVEADRFMERQRKRVASRQQICNGDRLRFLTAQDDR